LHVMGNEAVPAVGPEGIPPVGAGAGIALAMPAARDIKQYVNKLESLKARFSGSSFGVETLLDDQEELPARAILEVSRKQKADMIVMGSHGHGALHHLLTGSVTEGVLKAATCPVLVVPSKK